MIVADWVCIWWVVVRVAALDGRWREERKEHAASGSGSEPRRAAIFRNPVFISWLHQAHSCGSSRVWLALRALLELKWHPVKVYAPKQRGVTFGTKCTIHRSLKWYHPIDITLDTMCGDHVQAMEPKKHHESSLDGALLHAAVWDHVTQKLHPGRRGSDEVATTIVAMPAR